MFYREKILMKSLRNLFFKHAYDRVDFTLHGSSAAYIITPRSLFYI